MKKQWYATLLALLLAVALLLGGCASIDSDPTLYAPSALAAGTAAAEAPQTRLQDDFYDAVNADWLAAAKIPANEIAVGGFMDLMSGIETLLMADFKDMQSGAVKPGSAEMEEFLAYYALAADYETRNAQGAGPILPYLKEIDALTALGDLDAVLADWMRRGLVTPFSLGVMADMGDAANNALYAVAPGLFLPDASYYNTETGDQLLAYFAQTAQQLLVLAGYTEEEAAALTAQSLEYDALLAPYIRTAEEASEYTKYYNPVTLSDFTAHSGPLNLDRLITSLIKAKPAKVIVADPRFFGAMDSIITEKNFQILKSWLIVNTVYAASSYLSDDFRQTAASYSMILTGQTEMDDPQAVAYRLASSYYPMVVGNYYGEKYFGAEAKADVIGMVQSMVDVYKKRLAENDWLSKKTIDTALNKLDNMAIQIGYPDTLDPLYARMVVDESASLWDNAMTFTRLMLEDNYAAFGKKVDRSAWSMSADTVNAMYSPMTNTITFPAAILQAPFYSLEQTDAQNYGGIGAVIAHEITHAFDNNGAQFDELGNLKNWWTAQDYAAFEQRTKDMVALFDGMPFAGGAVSGTLTVSENIADAGGLSCALEAVKASPDAKLDEFFTNWAVIWRMKATEQYEQLLLVADVHAPNKLRANVQVQNLEDFYATFGVKEGDGMYLPADKRVSIW